MSNGGWRGWRGGSMAGSTCCPAWGWEFESQHPCIQLGIPHTSATQALRETKVGEPLGFTRCKPTQKESELQVHRGTLNQRNKAWNDRGCPIASEYTHGHVYPYTYMYTYHTHTHRFSWTKINVKWCSHCEKWFGNSSVREIQKYCVWFGWECSP